MEPIPVVQISKKLLSFLIVLLGIAGTAHAADGHTLQDAWLLAYQNNPALEAERAKLRATDEEVAQALSHWRPSINAYANAGRTWQYTPPQGGAGSNHFVQNSDSYGIQVKQPIFRGFRTLSETEAAEKKVLAERAHLQSAEQQLFYDTAKAYLDALRDESILTVDHENEDILRKKIAEIRERARVGDLTKTDLSQAQSRLSRAEVNRMQAEAALVTDRAIFARLVGIEAEMLKAPEFSFEQPKELDEVVVHALAVNPEIKAAQFAYDEANAEVNINKGNLLPEVNIVGSTSRDYNQSISQQGREHNSQIMAQLTLPLYSGGADYSKIRAASQMATSRRLELEEARHKSKETARSAWQMLVTSEVAIKADKAEIEASARALEGVRVQSKVGTRTTLDVLNAVQEFLDAKVDLARAEHDRNLAIVQLKAVLGELTADALKLPTDLYDAKKYYDDNAGKLIGLGDRDHYIFGAVNKISSKE